MKKNALRREKKLTDVIVKRLNELKRGGVGCLDTIKVWIFLPNLLVAFST